MKPLSKNEKNLLTIGLGIVFLAVFFYIVLPAVMNHLDSARRNAVAGEVQRNMDGIYKDFNHH